MSRSKVQANWKSVSFASTPITRVTSVQFDQGGNITYFKGDGDVMPTVYGLLDMKPTAQVTSADQYALFNIAVGTMGSFTATTPDLQAPGTTGYGVLYVLANAVYEGASGGGQQGQPGSASGSWGSISTDGTTSPLAVTLV